MATISNFALGKFTPTLAIGGGVKTTNVFSAPTARVSAPTVAAPSKFGRDALGMELRDPTSYAWDMPGIKNIDYSASAGSDPLAGAKEAYITGGSPQWGPKAADFVENMAKLDAVASNFRNTPGVLSPNQLAMRRYERTIGTVPMGERTMQMLQSGGYSLASGADLFNEIADEFMNQEAVKTQIAENWQGARDEIVVGQAARDASVVAGVQQATSLNADAKALKGSFVKQWGPALLAAAMMFVPGLQGVGLAAAEGLGLSGTSAVIAGGAITGGVTGAAGSAMTGGDLLEGALKGALGGAIGAGLGEAIGSVTAPDGELIGLKVDVDPVASADAAAAGDYSIGAGARPTLGLQPPRPGLAPGGVGITVTGAGQAAFVGGINLPHARSIGALDPTPGPLPGYRSDVFDADGLIGDPTESTGGLTIPPGPAYVTVSADGVVGPGYTPEYNPPAPSGGVLPDGVVDLVIDVATAALTPTYEGPTNVPDYPTLTIPTLNRNTALAPGVGGKRRGAKSALMYNVGVGDAGPGLFVPR